MKESGADWLCMAHDHNVSSAKLMVQLLEVWNDACCEFGDALAAGRPSDLTLHIPAVPLRIALERVEAPAGPLTHVELVEGRRDLDRQPVRFRDRLGRLPCSGLRARLHAVDRVPREPLTEIARLRSSRLAQPNRSIAPDQYMID
jgi:hypothetical protein